MPTLFQAPTKKQGKKSSTTPQVRSVMTPLTCFAINPSGVRFETQQDDESVILFLRQHIIVNVPWITISALLMIVPMVMFPMILANLKLPFIIPGGYILVGVLSWYLFILGFALTNFLRWFFNIYIVTTERIVDIDFIHILYKEFSEARLVNIQDITYNTGGIFESFFNYGNVLIQTAGTQPNFEFLSVPRPDNVVQTVSELVEKVKKEGGV
ncbi:MAG: hypothetical protein Q8L37_04335 [Candidatus Gottesmanbacteria bacterium]|nr:hypothetical protein [Candidatus Gottesmanbacteria bacterium]